MCGVLLEHMEHDVMYKNPSDSLARARDIYKMFLWVPGTIVVDLLSQQSTVGLTHPTKLAHERITSSESNKTSTRAHHELVQ